MYCLLFVTIDLESRSGGQPERGGSLFMDPSVVNAYSGVPRRHSLRYIQGDSSLGAALVVRVLSFWVHLGVLVLLTIIVSFFCRRYLPSMAWFRELTCDEGTSNSLCVVPVEGGLDFESEEMWCRFNYNVTTCTDIRDRAQADTLKDMMIFYYVCACE